MATIFITGANRGIGLELARQHVQRGDTVIATHRAQVGGLADLPVRTLPLDVTDDDACAALPQALGDVALDRVYLNAGLLRRSSLDALDLRACREMFEVNSLGPLKVAAALRSRLTPGARIGVVTSRMGSIADNTSGGAYGYRMSKAAVNAVGRSLAHDLADAGVSVRLLHPGYVRTDMTGGSGLVDPPESAAGLIARMDELDPGTSGDFVHMNGDPLPW